MRVAYLFFGMRCAMASEGFLLARRSEESLTMVVAVGLRSRF